MTFTESWEGDSPTTAIKRPKKGKRKGPTVTHYLLEKEKVQERTYTEKKKNQKNKKCISRESNAGPIESFPEGTQLF